MQPVVGIIGFWFVGKAIAHGFGPVVPILYYDPKHSEGNTFEEVVTKSNFIFVGVPTPMKDGNGAEIDSTILDGVIEQLNNRIAKLSTFKTSDAPVVIIKSTVTPNVLMRYTSLYPDLRLVFSPEFLTERTAYLDFMNATRIILGGKRVDTDAAERLHRIRFLHTPIYHCDLIAASLVKYMCNAFFSVKVSFLNEMRDVVLNSSSTTSWDQVVAMFLADQRIGNSHYQVPGPDGKFGFGGKCLPKDLNAIIHYSKEVGCSPNTLEAAWETNLRVRGDKDWNRIEGAVTTKEAKKS